MKIFVILICLGLNDGLILPTSSPVATIKNMAFEKFQLSDGKIETSYSLDSHTPKKVYYFKDVEFGLFGASSLKLSFQSKNVYEDLHGKLQFQVDGPDGKIISTIEVTTQNASNISKNITLESPVVYVDGTHDLYVKSSSGPLPDDFQFYFTPSGPRPTAYYSIMSVRNGKVVSTRYKNAGDHAILSMWPFQNTTNQFFQFIPIDSVWYKILLIDGGRALTVTHHTNNIELIILANFQNMETQQWRLQRTSNQHWQLVARSSYQCLDIRDGNNANNANLIQYPCQHVNNGNQEWILMNPMC